MTKEINTNEINISRINTSEITGLVKEIAKPFESLFLKAYHDPVGYPTIGYGHLLSYNKWEALSKYPDIDKHTAEILLEKDIRKALSAVLFNVKPLLSSEKLAALTDFVFNVGPGNFRISTMLKMINRGDIKEAANQFPRWNKAGGIIFKGLTRRRLVEKELYLRK
jgi:GH24 family phage-related lysozyme (muramidase)